MTDTWDLVERAQGGEGAALERLISRYYGRVRRAVRARIGPQLRRRLETEDILLPAFAKAFRKFDQFEMRDEGSLMNWLAEHAKRVLLDRVDYERAQRRNPGAPVVSIGAAADSDEPEVDVHDPATGPVGRAEREEHEGVIEECLDLLPEQYRAVIVLRDYDGLDWNAVAERLGKNTESAARQQHRRALLELAFLLRRRGIRPGQL